MDVPDPTGAPEPDSADIVGSEQGSTDVFGTGQN